MSNSSLPKSTELRNGSCFSGRFDNASDEFRSVWCRLARQRQTRCWRAETDERHSSQRATARVAMAVGKISFQDASVAVRLQSTEQRALWMPLCATTAATYVYGKSMVRSNGSRLEIARGNWVLFVSRVRNSSKVNCGPGF